jgi:hypothetical protein
MSNFLNSAAIRPDFLKKYNSTIKYVKVICSCGTTYNKLRNKFGCPKCIDSSNINKIKTYFNDNNINYEENKIPDNYPNELLKDPLDFYITSSNIAIEYYGGKKYGYNDYYHKTIHDYINQKYNDDVKVNFCNDNNITLYILKEDDDINTKLNEIFT